MKRIILFMFLILSTLLCCSAYAENEIFTYSFTSAQDESAWYGSFFDESVQSEKGYCAYVKNPFGEEKKGLITHVIDYAGKIHLEEGKIYTLSGYVMNPLNEYNKSINTSADLLPSANTVIVTVSGASDVWTQFTTTFYAGKTGYFNLSLHFTGGNVDFGFFVDEITLYETSHTLSLIKAEGAEKILIPSTNSTRASYRPVLITTDGTKINVLSNESIVSSCSVSSGVSYNPHDFILTVDKNAVAPSKVTIYFALKNSPTLTPYSLDVTLTDNMIGDFLNEDKLKWTSTSHITYSFDDIYEYMSLPTNDYGSFGYFSTINYDTPQLLIEGELYVVRAKVRLESAQAVSSIYAKNLAYTLDNTVYFNISDISQNEWTDVFAAFVPEVSGIYSIAVNLCSTYDSIIYVTDLRLCTESPRAEYITLHAPGNIAIPDVATSYPVSGFLRDQMGNIIGDNITICLEGETSSIFFDDAEKLLTVYPDAIEGNYTLKAYFGDNNEIQSTLPISVSHNFIGDGGFEEKSPNEWWMATSPYMCDFYIRNDGYGKRGLVSCAGDYFLLLNNSYIRLTKGLPYVFNGAFSPSTDCTITLFLEEMDDTLNPLAQFYVSANATLSEKINPELFLAEKTAVGRLFLYIQSDNGEPFSIYADDLSVQKALIVAGNLHITGSATVNGSVQANFSFYNSVAQNSDTSSCIVNWYISDSPNSDFSMLSHTGKYIYFDTTFLNKYVYFEVIPVCPLTGFSGDALKLTPFKVTFDSLSSTLGTQFAVPSLNNLSDTSHFSDTKGHWASDSINLLTANDILSGKSDTVFAPDESITRAEFAKLVFTAFCREVNADFSMFGDIEKTDWFYKSVQSLNIYGIINGTSANTFSPYNSITREDAVVILMRVYEKFSHKGVYFDDKDFVDSQSISSYALSYVKLASQAGIISGNPIGMFCPKASLSRAEATVMIHRLIVLLGGVS